MLSRQRPPIQKVGRYRRPPNWKTSSPPGLLLASCLVQISLRCNNHVLYSRARQTVRPISGLVRDADLPPRVQESGLALGGGRVGELAGDSGADAHALMDVSVPEAS